MTNKLCLHCGTAFEPKRIFQKYCKRDCQMVAFYLKKINAGKKVKK